MLFRLKEDFKYSIPFLKSIYMLLLEKFFKMFFFYMMNMFHDHFGPGISYVVHDPPEQVLVCALDADTPP